MFSIHSDNSYMMQLLERAWYMGNEEKGRGDFKINTTNQKILKIKIDGLSFS